MYMLYSVSLCCFVYCLCVYVYLHLPPGLNPIAVNDVHVGTQDEKCQFYF